MGMRSIQPNQQNPAKSSITNEERRIFENIRSKFGGSVSGILPPPPLSKSVPEAKILRQTSRNLPIYDLSADKILSLFAPEMAVESSSDNFEPVAASTSSSEAEAETYTDAPRLATPAEVRTTARTVLQQISDNIIKCLRSADIPPEHALWTHINAEIFPVVALLQHPLLRPTANSFHRPYQLTLGELTSSDPETPLALPSCLAEVPPQTPVLPLITILYPAATLMAMRNYAAYLPASDYAFSLYPSIQNLGTTSFLLGANVHFFNSLIQLQWEVYSDLTEIFALLDDMRSSVVAYDARTLAILRAILEDSRSTGGDGRAKEWWAEKSQISDINSLTSYWIPRVERSVNKGLKASR